MRLTIYLQSLLPAAVIAADLSQYALTDVSAILS